MSAEVGPMPSTKTLVQTAAIALAVVLGVRYYESKNS